jgi:FMN phosphatase YigB (HAD superfamily)
LFQFVVESALVGLRKPDQRIFELAIQKANEWMRTTAATTTQATAAAAAAVPLQADQVLFLDDLGVNLKAAQKCGITTIKVTSDYGLALRQLSSLTGVPLDSIIATIPPPAAPRALPAKL